MGGFNQCASPNRVGSHSLLQGIFSIQGLKCTASGFFTIWTTREDPIIPLYIYIINMGFSVYAHVSLNWNGFWKHPFITVGQQSWIQRIFFLSNHIKQFMHLPWFFNLGYSQIVNFLYHIPQTPFMMLHLRKSRNTWNLMLSPHLSSKLKKNIDVRPHQCDVM